jgi:hypothetical protein
LNLGLKIAPQVAQRVPYDQLAQICCIIRLDLVASILHQVNLIRVKPPFLLLAN